MRLNQQELLIALFTLLFTGLLWPLKIAAQEVCLTPPNTQQLNQFFGNSLSSLPQKSEIRLLILPFEDGSQLSDPDTALSKAFAIALYDLLSPLDKAAVYHPALAINISENTKTLFDENLFLGQAKEQKATHLVTGLFQKQNGNLRLFIKMTDVTTGKQIRPPLEFALREDDGFFSSMADLASDILLATTGKKTNPELFAAYLVKTPSFEAFRYYVKGIEKSFSYDPVNLEVAKAWFEKAVRLSFRFSDAELEKKRILWMMALFERQMKKDVSLLLTEAGNIKAQPFTFVKGSASKLTFKRWEEAFKLANTSSYLPAEKAIVNLAKAIQLTPEDSWLYHEYAQRLKQTGKSYGDAQLKASQINPCIPSI